MVKIRSFQFSLKNNRCKEVLRAKKARVSLYSTRGLARDTVRYGLWEFLRPGVDSRSHGDATF